MSRNERGGDEESSLRRRASTSSPPRIRTRKDPFLVACRCFSVLVCLAALLCIFVNVLSAIRSFKSGGDVFDGIFRCYAVGIAVFVVVAETEWEFIFNFWRVLEYWSGRGMLQIFVAVMTRAFPDYIGERRNLVLIQDISSYLLLACGVTYVISYPDMVDDSSMCLTCLGYHFNRHAMGTQFGVLCCGFLKRARQSKEITRDQAVKDLEELERRREELEALLIVERA